MAVSRSTRTRWTRFCEGGGTDYRRLGGEGPVPLLTFDFDVVGAPMIRKIVLFSTTAVLAIGVAATLVHSQTAGDALDPVRVAADTHRVAFENAFVRVLEVRIPPGKTEPRHRHPHGLSVYFSDWDAKVTVDGKPAQVNPRKTGTFAWSDAVVHTVENAGKTEGRVLRIELKY